MRAVQVIAPGQVVFIETPKPELKPGHALVRTRRLSLCGSDVHMIHHSLLHKYPFPPGTSGHEMVGVVEAVDPPDGPVRPGDLALTLVVGHRSMAEYYLAPLEHVFPLPPGKPIEHYLQAQQLGTVIYASKRLPNLLDRTVAVIGQGSAGLWFNLMARRMGAKQVIGVDMQGHRLALSAYYGATHTVHNAENDAAAAVSEITGGRMADVVVEAAGEVSAIRLAVELARPFGFVLYFGVPRTAGLPDIQFPFEPFFQKCLQAQAIVNAMEEPNQSSTRLALQLIADGIADPGPMLTHHFPFDQVLDAYELQRTPDEGAVKIVIDMPE